MAAERGAAALAYDGLRIAVVAALALERTSLGRHAAPAARAARASRAAAGNGTPRAVVTIHQSGPGAERAAYAAHAALAGGAAALVSWGFAGGLDPTLAPGSVVVPRAVLANGTRYACAAEWAAAVRAAALADAMAVRDGDLLSVAAPLGTPLDKARARDATGAVAADMESGAIAAVAAAAGAPFIAVRVVVDACGDTLPLRAERWIDARGNTRPFAALAAAFMPADWPRLVTLARRYRDASAALEALAATLVPAGFAHAPAAAAATAAAPAAT